MTRDESSSLSSSTTTTLSNQQQAHHQDGHLSHPSLNFSFESFKNQFHLHQHDEQQAYHLYLVYLDIVFVKKIPRQEYNRILSVHSFSWSQLNHQTTLTSASPFCHTIYYLYSLLNIPNMNGMDTLSELKSLNDIHCEPKHFVIVPISMSDVGNRSNRLSSLSIRHYHELIEAIRKQFESSSLDGIVMCFIDGDGTLMYYQMDQKTTLSGIL
nr:unnamed protein product [Naegleria fowleri]